MKDPNGTWKCSCGAVKDQGMAADMSWRWNGADWEHRCPGNHPQAGHMQAEFIPSPKIKFLKFTHPKMSGYLITELGETRENVAQNYLCDFDTDPTKADLDLFKACEVEMTQEEFNALPEFEG